jgi:TetR/AcrR family transcriptional regulator
MTSVSVRNKRTRKGVLGGRERLLRAAVRLFAAKGYAATTVRDILRSAGVTAPVLYHHFGNKEGVFLALVCEGIQKLDAALEKSLRQAGTAATRIRGYCRAAAKVRREHADLARIVEAILSGPPEAGPPFDLQALVASRVRRVEGLVREGIRNGEFRKCDPLHAALALVGAVEIAARPHMFESETSVADDRLEGMVSVILGGLAAPRAPRARSRR